MVEILNLYVETKQQWNTGCWNHCNKLFLWNVSIFVHPVYPLPFSPSFFAQLICTHISTYSTNVKCKLRNGCDCWCLPLVLYCLRIHVWILNTHARTYARSLARPHARTHARAGTHARTHACMCTLVHIQMHARKYVNVCTYTGK